MKNTSQSQHRLKRQITKYDSLKFSLKVRVKNSKCSSILLLGQMFLRIPRFHYFPGLGRHYPKNGRNWPACMRKAKGRFPRSLRAGSLLFSTYRNVLVSMRRLKIGWKIHVLPGVFAYQNERFVASLFGVLRIGSINQSTITKFWKFKIFLIRFGTVRLKTALIVAFEVDISIFSGVFL
jgi:hypothetical protein